MMQWYDIEKCVERVKKYCSSPESDFSQPLFISTNNKEDYLRLKEKISILSKVLTASSFCRNNDSEPRVLHLIDELRCNRKSLLLIGFDQFLLLKGKKTYSQEMAKLCSMSIQGRVMVLCCWGQSELLQIAQMDLRRSRRFCFVNSVQSELPKIVFVKPNLIRKEQTFKGFKELLEALENSSCDIIWTCTEKKRINYPESIFILDEIIFAYDALRLRCPEICECLDLTCGSEADWRKLLQGLEMGKSFRDLLQISTNDFSAWEILFPHWKSRSAWEKWLCFVVLKWKGSKCEYLQLALDRATDIKSFQEQLYNVILSYKKDDAKFYILYNERKQILETLGEVNDCVVGFCQAAGFKGKDKIYYLTDLTEYERFEVIKCLSQNDYEQAEVLAAVHQVYPALEAYLKDYFFNIPLLDEYFSMYKYQKVKNSIQGNFMMLVEKNAKERIYNRILPTRSSVFEKVHKFGDYVYFIDALGVEYLGYIRAMCQKLCMTLKVHVCHANLPTITIVNKDFENYVEESHYVNIKDLDEVKHHGEADFDYQKVKEPIYLAKELEILGEVLTKIKTKLVQNVCKKVIIISDHGASRLAVICNSEAYKYDVDSKGTHAGRCCVYKEELEDIPYAAEENGYYVLASYDRFKGSRAASVETHGGATLEEVVIPLLEITSSVESTNVIRFVQNRVMASYRHPAEIIIFSVEPLHAVLMRVKVKNVLREYKAEKIDEQHYRVIMLDIKRKGVFKADIYDDGDLICEGIVFYVDNEGMKENSLL